eukprot:945293-Pleurochrysis_carterae.AAC.1
MSATSRRVAAHTRRDHRVATYGDWRGNARRARWTWAWSRRCVRAHVSWLESSSDARAEQGRHRNRE